MDMNFFGGLVAGLAIGALVGAWLWRSLVLEDVLDLSGTSLGYWLRRDDMERIERTKER